MTKPKVLIFSGYGLNSEEETAYGFELAGATTNIIHINDIIDGFYTLDKYQILSFPGGFSYGDDTGAGNAYANRIKNHLWEAIHQFIQKDTLIIGICNGCQIVHNLGIVPNFSKDQKREIALGYNTSARFITRWVDMKVTATSPWLRGITEISLPIAHGEGRFMASNNVITQLQQKQQIALTYTKGEMCAYLDLPSNPNGSMESIAGIIDPTGKILGLMPHPERGMFFVQRPDWQLQKEVLLRKKGKLPKFGPGLQLFQNAVQYYS